MVKLATALIALLAPVSARELMPAQRTLLSSDSDILAAVPTMKAYNEWANGYIRQELPGAISRLADCCDYADYEIGDGGYDLFDNGNQLRMRTKQGKEYFGAILYTKQKGPKAGAVQTQTYTGDNGNNLDVISASLGYRFIFAGVYQFDGGVTMDGFYVGGETGVTNTVFLKGNGAFTFNSIGYEYFWIMKKDDTGPSNGKFDLVVIDSADGAQHCMNYYCHDSDYDYHRILDKVDGFTSVGYTLWASPWNFDTTTYTAAEYEAVLSVMAKYSAALVQNLLTTY